MNIALYTGSALPKLGGQEAVVDALARQFLHLGHCPTVIAPMPRRLLRPRDGELPYPVVRHPRFYSTKHLVGWYRRYLKAAHADRRFDVVHCHDVYPTGYVASLCKAFPLVITSHGGDVRPGNARLVKAGMRPRFLQAVAAADALISIGRFTTTGFGQLNADPAKIIDLPNGVDLGPFASSAARPLDLDVIPGRYDLFLGRLAERKGADTLIRALHSIPRIGSVELVLAGSGTLFDDLKFLARPIADRVRFVGRVEGPVKTWLLQNARCVLTPSRGWEAFPLTVLEAFAAGRPVIGSNIPGLDERITPDVGLLVPPDDVPAWAAALTRVRDNPEWVRSTGDRAASVAAEFSWDRIARRHVDLYTRLATPR